MRIILSLVLAVLSLGTPARAASTLTSGEQEALTDIVAAMSDPPHLQIRAALTPPLTTYTVEMVNAEKERVAMIGKRAEDAGFRLSVSIDPGGIEKWLIDISCGTFEVDYGIASWSHPEGDAPKGCPHPDGTDHGGTVKNRGTAYLGVSRGTESFLSGIWGYECTYANGSVSGVSEDCVVTLQNWRGADGIVMSEAYGSPSGIEFEGWHKYVGVAIVLGGLTYFLYRRVEKNKK